MYNNKTVIVGGVPQPVGGVTGYIYRLCHHLNNEIDCVIDLYAHEEKWTISNVKLITRKNGLISLLKWFFISVFKILLARKIYFNFSGTKFLALAFFIPKMPWQTWILTLHHGELQSSNGLGKLEHWGLRRMNKIGHIGNKQLSFYLKNACRKNKLFPIVPFLPYVEPPQKNKNFDDTLLLNLKKIRAKHSKILLASGYPSLIYHHEWIIEYMDNLAHNADIGFILCLYGNDPENRRETLKACVKQNPNIYLFEYLQPDAFQEVLKIIDIYLRPNSIDSYGVAVGEAISLNKVTIASDACDRFEGAKLFNVGDKEAFYTLIEDALNNRLKAETKTQNDSIIMCKKLLA